MSLSINQKSPKHDWLKYLKEIYFDSSLEEKCLEAQCWIQYLDPEIPSAFSPGQIRSGVIKSWNKWSKEFHSRYPDFYRYLNKRGYFRGTLKFFRLINKDKHISLSHLQAIDKKLPIGKLFIALAHLITATIDILEDREHELLWIKHFFRKDKISRRIVLNIIRRAHPNSSLFRGRIHPSSE